MGPARTMLVLVALAIGGIAVSHYYQQQKYYRSVRPGEYIAVGRDTSYSSFDHETQIPPARTDTASSGLSNTGVQQTP